MSYNVRNPELEAALRAIADDLRAKLPAGLGFALMLFEMPEGALFYISNANRDEHGEGHARVHRQEHALTSQEIAAAKQRSLWMARILEAGGVPKDPTTVRALMFLAAYVIETERLPLDVVKDAVATLVTMLGGRVEIFMMPDAGSGKAN